MEPLLDTQQSTGTLASEINEFAEALSYSGRHISKIILTAGTFTAADIDTAYNYFLEDANLKEKLLERPTITFGDASLGESTYKKDLLFTTLENVEGVNALAEKQKIEFHPNLTIVYGVNGSGKSGYARLLKKVFYSRAPEEILGNVNVSVPKPLSADFTFKSGEAIETIKYPEHSKNFIFRQFSVFDDKSISVQLNQRNQFEFRPAGLSYFSMLISAFREIEQRLSADVASRSTALDYVTLFEGDSPIKTLLGNLDDKKVLENLRNYLPYSEKDETDVKALEEKKIALLATKKDKEIADLQEKKRLLLTCKTNVLQLNKWFTSQALTKIKGDIDSANKAVEIASKEGIAAFNSENIKELGSPEWKSFIEAAEKFAKTQGEYPGDGDVCILCQQPLSDVALELIRRYWVFVSSSAEKNAAETKELVQKSKAAYEKLSFQILAEDSVLFVWLNDKYPSVLKQLKGEIEAQQKLCANVINDLKTLSGNTNTHIQIDTAGFDMVAIAIDAQIADLEKSNPNAEIDVINKQLTLLAHKRKLEQYLPDIEKIIANKVWCTQATKVSRQLSSRKITDKEKALSSKYFNLAYVDKFNAECRDLRADFGVDINHTGTLGTSYKQLLFKNYSPSSVLSIGEQKVISIADFLTEVQLSEINKGIIFDDPVSSLDDERKSDIADRLVIESTKRQVIIFTHDLVFVSSLLLSCEKRNVKSDCHWIENAGNNPGVVWLRNTPVFEKSYKKSSKAQEHYEAAKKAGPEERETSIKNGFASLRTSYEALVIFELFSGVVQRFNERVSVDSLSSVYFDESIKEEILDSFYQCCRYMEGHSHSDKYAYKKPTIENLNEEIQRFNKTRKNLTDVKAAQEKAKKN